MRCLASGCKKAIKSPSSFALKGALLHYIYILDLTLTGVGQCLVLELFEHHPQGLLGASNIIPHRWLMCEIFHSLGNVSPASNLDPPHDIISCDVPWFLPTQATLNNLHELPIIWVNETNPIDDG